MITGGRGAIFVDGSRLFSSIFEIWRTRPDCSNKKAHVGELSNALIRALGPLFGVVVRVTYYFKKADDRMQKLLTIPDATQPSQKSHWRIIECGQSLTAIPDEQLQLLAPEYRDQFARAEKGLDMRLACDALFLVASGKLSDTAFLVNDRDYVPLFETLERLGANVYLVGLDETQQIAKALAELADSYITLNGHFSKIFGLQS